jgi:hypothetical protein
VLVVAVVDPRADTRADLLRGFLSRFLATETPLEINLAGVARWLEKEAKRHTGRDLLPVEFSTRGPVQAAAPPPLPPAPGDPFLDRYRKTRDFLGYFHDLGERENLVIDAYDAVVFVYFFDEELTAEYARQHSIASRRHRLGVVFSPIDPRSFSRCAVLTAHELCHTLGATDKYDGERCVFPTGFAEPDREPRYPQSKAEIMALGVPLEPGIERRVEWLGECVIGEATAAEIGWLELGAR